MKKRIGAMVLTLLGFAWIGLWQTGHTEERPPKEEPHAVVASIEEDEAGKVRTATINPQDLKEGENIVYQTDTEVVALNLLPVHKLDEGELCAQGKCDWTDGKIGGTATLTPSHCTELCGITYTVDWKDYEIVSVHSLTYRVGGATVTKAEPYIVRATAIDGLNATAIGEVQLIQGFTGGPVIAYNNWLRIEINSETQMRVSWNY